ncbi:DUF1697 domain-containing protein [Limimaricola sp.]|uniref:DUF1697 domain-containing protein n=1 Tax=Limimaricola sp. TaxID=2211665 RepID=UPI0025C0089C|nr:DUF1697 domain-containing protein [Limimaricola sp.]
MQHWVALLRGVNVGGANMVPMAKLREVAAGLGWQGVRSHLASGNLVFAAAGEAEGLARALEGALTQALGVSAAVLVIAAPDWAAMLAECPFAPDAGKAVHGFFCWQTPLLDEGLLATLIAPSETVQVRGKVIWLHAPEGVGRSKLAAKMGAVAGKVQMTARNLNTIRALAEMLDEARGAC